jgi:hypothetical protein
MTRRTTWRSAAPAAVAALVACSGGEGAAPPKPASVAAVSTTGLTATVGTILSPAPQFVVRDASGNAMSDVAVTVTVGSGGGTISGAPSKTAAGGTTSVGAWMLGNTAGANTLTITVSGLTAPLILSATGTPDVPSQITVASGNQQAALGGATLATPMAFKVADKFNNGVAGQVVTFLVTGGGGSLAATGSVTTDQAGIAVAPAWTLGKSTAAQQLRATSGALTVTATATVTSDYAVDVRFFGPAVDPTIQAAFVNGAARVQALVTGDVPNITLNQFSVAGCNAALTTPLSELVDDIIVYAQVAPIDGVGNILGSAGPCFVRSTGGLSLIAVMNFDVADLQNLQTSNRLNDVILHELLHTVGFGTLWASKGQVSNANSVNTGFIGAQAVGECLNAGGAANCATVVPLEACGGVGTRDVHWREPTTNNCVNGPEGTFGFRTELMTGFISAAGTANPLSRMSIASLADIGYVVNLLAGDAYTVPSALLASFQRIREAQGLGPMPLNDLVLEPIGAVDGAGRVTYFKPRQ